MTSPDFASLSAEPYVLLTTFRASGIAVSTPVWIVEGRDGLLVTTSGESGKVKRIRRNATVELTPCDARGVIAAGTRAIQGIASVHTDANSRVAIDAALDRKYGLRYKAIKAAGRLRGAAQKSVVVRIAPEA